MVPACAYNAVDSLGAPSYDTGNTKTFAWDLALDAVYFPQIVMTNQSGQWLINDSLNAVGLSVLSQLK